MRITSLLKIRLLAPLALALAVLAGPDSGRADPVVVELFTSQGCSSCPPADELLRKLAERDDVIVLALHVDYWDYIGWKDTFGQRKFTVRQKGYARAAGKRMVYTPQMVIDGKDHVEGTRPGKLLHLIRRHKAEADSDIDLSVRRTGDRIRIDAKAAKRYEVPLWVQIVRVKPEATVEIRRGENAGKRITYSNIVTDWRRLDPWDTRAPLAIEAEAGGDEDVVVIIQRPEFGPILAAAKASE